MYRLPTSRCRPPRGFTLLEILTAAAVGLLIIAAAMAVFTTINQQMQDAERKTQAISNIQLGTAVMVRDLENAGFHFAAATRAITIRNNVAAGTLPNGFGVSTTAVAARVYPAPTTTLFAMADEGIVEGTDVVEVLKGTITGNLSKVMSSGTGGLQSITFDPATPPPNWSGGTGPTLLFRNTTTECLGVMIGAATAPSNVQMVTRDFVNDAAGPAGCPVAGMDVWELFERNRYMVYQFQGEVTPTLAVQKSIDTAGTLSPTVEPLVEGIEDMQVSGSLRNRGQCAVPADKICSCDDGLDDATGMPGGTDCVLDQNNLAQAKYLRGVHIEFTSRGTKVQGFGLPVSYDRIALAPDGFRREQLFISVVAPNINPDTSSFAGGTGGGP